MSSDILLHVGGAPVWIKTHEHLTWVGELTVDADGSPRAYGPEPPHGLDYLANAGYPGNWWGIATDSGDYDGEPVVQGEGDPYPGLYVSTTAYIYPEFAHTDPKRYVDSESVPFIVIPSSVRNACEGKCKGCRAIMTDLHTRKSITCVVADIGPSDHLGEASMAAARFFGIDDDPKKGGSSDSQRWRYDCFPGIPAKGFTLQ